MDPNRAKTLLLVAIVVGALLAFMLLRRALGMLKFTGRIAIGLLIAVGAGWMWWTGQQPAVQSEGPRPIAPAAAQDWNASSTDPALPWRR